LLFVKNKLIVKKMNYYKYHFLFSFFSTKRKIKKKLKLKKKLFQKQRYVSEIKIHF
jgi:hypothetical protein